MIHALWRAAVLGLLAVGTAGAEPLVIEADGYLDVVAGRIVSPAVIVVEGERIAAVNPATRPAAREDDCAAGPRAAAGPHGRARAPQLHHRRGLGDGAGPLYGRRLRAARYSACFEDAARRLHDGARPRHRTRLFRRRADARDRQGLGHRAAADPRRPRAFHHRRPLRPVHWARAGQSLRRTTCRELPTGWTKC